MCGKFTAMASWREVVAFSQPLTGGNFDGEEREITFRVMGNLPVIIWDRETGKRRVAPMRWGFPHRQDWRRPDPIHARAETIEQKPTFRDAFHDGQRGIVLFKTFNEGEELPNGKTQQYTIRMGDRDAAGFAFLWRRYELEGLPTPLLACVMATVPANALIAPITDRMPAILALDDWAKWLGEESATVDELKACLKTVEGLRWTMEKEPPKPKAKKPNG